MSELPGKVATARTDAQGSEIQFRIATAESDVDQVRALLREYNEFLFTIIDPALLRHCETEIEALPGTFAAPRGALLLATVGGRPSGCIGLRPVALPNGEEAAECCRMGVSNAA